MADAEEAGTKWGGLARWVAIAAVVSLVIGWATSGDLIYHSLIGLDSSHFPGGEWIQTNLVPGATKAMGGVVVGMSDVLQNEAALYPAVYAYIAGCGAAIIDQVNAR